MVAIGVLGVQGDFLEHVELLREMGVSTKVVKRPEELAEIDGLIIPGGESTTIGSLIAIKGLGVKIQELAERGVPIMGVCAGAVLLAKKVVDRVVGETGQYLLSLMNIGVVRNVYGRQSDSFITDIYIEGLGVVKAAFIRAPGIVEAWEPAKIKAYLEHPRAGRMGVFAEQGNLIAVTFHPEITGDSKVHAYFIEKVRR